jgi:VWFA-related protein
MTVTRRELLALGASVLPGARLFGQDLTFSADVKVVNVLVGVRDKKGEIVRGLTRRDFTLEEDGRPQNLQYFSEQSDLALTLGLLVDTSGSQRYVLADERRASLQFLRSVMREDRDQAFVIHFAGEVELLQDLTSSRRALEAALDDPATGWAPPGRLPRRWPPMLRGATALYDAVLLASDEMMRQQTGRKALIVLSDGNDNDSKVTLNRAIEAAQRADTLVYSILFSGTALGPPVRIVFGPWGVPGSAPVATTRLSRSKGARTLQRISRETGGSYFEVSARAPLEQIYARIEQELRSQYNLGYTPAGPKPGYHKIKVTVAGRGLAVQARAGYYAD